MFRRPSRWLHAVLVGLVALAAAVGRYCSRSGASSLCARAGLNFFGSVTCPSLGVAPISYQSPGASVSARWPMYSSQTLPTVTAMQLHTIYPKERAMQWPANVVVLNGNGR